jgi:hypothetical protein
MKNTVLTFIVALGMIGSACAAQPNMQKALENLRSAKASLEAANNNKGGWRLAAIAAVNKAINETEKGIRAAE